MNLFLLVYNNRFWLKIIGIVMLWWHLLLTKNLSIP